VFEIGNIVEKVYLLLKAFPFYFSQGFLIFRSVDGGEVAFFVADNGGSSWSVIH
jgi:hypothetical protein